MLIDWFTVGAQALNFIILVWLLQRFLYRPILGAIDAREKRIAQALADVDRQRSELQKSRDELQAKSKTFDDQRSALLAKAELDAKSKGERLLGDARQAAESFTSNRNAALQSETARLSDELARLAAAESLNIARAALESLAGADLEERIIEVFARRLREMDLKSIESFGSSLKRPDGESVVASSFELSDREKGAIQTAVNETFSADIRLHFLASSNGVGGIELNSGGQRLSWTITDYLGNLEEKVAALLKVGRTPASIPATPANPTADKPGAPAIPQPASAVLPPNPEAPAAAA
jgi:F-type H+-transporting ATPase subunit b